LEWRQGDSLGITNRGTEAKSTTSCDNASVTNILLLPLRCTHAFAQKTSVGPRPYSEAKRLIERPQEALLCAKAKRQQQSAQSERKSTTRYNDEPKKRYFLN